MTDNIRPNGAEGLWYEVWRQDDHGTKYRMLRTQDKVEADELAAKMTARGHKQMYWVETKDN